METTERLYRQTSNKVIGGVASGLADYFNIDVVLARVVFVLLAFFGGGGVLIYIVMWIIIPAQNTNYHHQQRFNDGKTTNESSTDESADNFNQETTGKRTVNQSNKGLIAGIVLIFLGMLFLVDRLLPWYHVTEFWPLLLVAIGVLIIKPDIFKPSKKQSNEI